MNNFYFIPSKFYNLEEPSRWSLNFYTSDFALNHSRPKKDVSQAMPYPWIVHDNLYASAFHANPFSPSAWKCATRQVQLGVSPKRRVDG